jgi:C-8 sterol isomerase
MLPFGFFDTFFSTLDFQTLLHTVRISALAMGQNLLKGKI